MEVAKTPPQKRSAAVEPRWTTKRLVNWVKETFKIDCSRETVRKALKQLGLSWKKSRKLLNKADPVARAAYLDELKGRFEEVLKTDRLLVYIDEAHIHLDTDEGYGWSIRNERYWVSSSSPGRQKVSFYGLYLYNLGQVRIFPFEKANQWTTIEVLKRLRCEFPEREITVIWDGVPYHRTSEVLEAARVLKIEVKRLPAYSPDFMPVEHLWHWLREEVTYHCCYPNQPALKGAVAAFAQRINQDPLSVGDRLWVQNHLDEEVEKLRVSSW